jgi:hypothetical protein
MIDGTTRYLEPLWQGRMGGQQRKFPQQAVLAIVYQPKRRCQHQMKQFYTKPLERHLEEVYNIDYQNSFFGFEKAPIVEPNDFIYANHL